MAIANNQIETNENKNKEKEVKQYIVVQIGSEKYGIDISYVDNIVRMQKITRVPKAQEYFKGIINLRGEIVPVMSIRLKMGLGSKKHMLQNVYIGCAAFRIQVSR